MTLVHLVYGGDSQARELAIAAQAAQATPGTIAVALLEGLPLSGKGLESSEALKIIRIAQACPCCTGNLTMRVTLNRLLRNPPETLFLSLADESHLESTRSFLQQEQYCGRLQSGSDVVCRSGEHVPAG